MRCYEYIRLGVNLGDLQELNALASVGWHVVGTTHEGMDDFVALLERELTKTEDIEITRRYYEILNPSERGQNSA